MLCILFVYELMRHCNFYDNDKDSWAFQFQGHVRPTDYPFKFVITYINELG